MTDRDFNEIYEEFRGPVTRYLSRLVSEGEAEDLAQEVFVKDSGGLSGFRGGSKLSTWIYRIATNTALDRLKSPSGRTIQAAAGDTDGDILPSPDTPLDKRLEQEQMSECVQSVIDELPPDYRVAIVLSEIGGLSGPEMAEVLGVSEGAAKIRLHRARERLRELLDKRCDFVRDERNVFCCVPKPTPIKFRKDPK